MARKHYSHLFPTIGSLRDAILPKHRKKYFQDRDSYASSRYGVGGGNTDLQCHCWSDWRWRACDHLVVIAKPAIVQLIDLTHLELKDTAVNVTLVMAAGMILRVFNMVGTGGVLKSGGDINYSIFIDIFGQWAIGISLAYFTALVLGWSLEWVLMIVLLEELAKIALTSQRIHSKKWINNLIEEPNQLAA